MNEGDLVLVSGPDYRDYTILKGRIGKIELMMKIRNTTYYRVVLDQSSLLDFTKSPSESFGWYTGENISPVFKL